jgi:pyruvate kinase
VGSNAILDGTDTVLLSVETATGQYPVEAVRMMTAITQSVEASDIFKTLMHKNVLTQEELLANACLAGESLVSIRQSRPLIVPISAGSSTVPTTRWSRHTLRFPVKAHHLRL